MKKIYLPALLVLVVLFSGCQTIATGPYFVPYDYDKDNSALLYIYSDYNDIGMSTPTVLLNGVKLGSLASEGYLYKNISSGEYEIKIPKSLTWNINTFKFTLNAENGNEYYIKHTVSLKSSSSTPQGVAINRFTSKLEQVPKRIALKEIAQKRLSK